jgi:hypothetical protein
MNNSKCLCFVFFFFLICFTPLDLGKEVKISFVGGSLREDCLTLFMVKIMNHIEVLPTKGISMNP